MIFVLKPTHQSSTGYNVMRRRNLFNKEISGTTKIDVGLLFVIFACAYMFTSPLWGILIGRFPVSRSVMFFGSFFAAFSYFFLGPSSLLRSIGLYFSCSFTSIGMTMAVLGLSPVFRKTLKIP